MKTRQLKCFTCGNKWNEPVRPGARPWECPTCNPQAAKRREAERERAARKTQSEALDSPAIEVPPFMRDVVEEVLRLAADHRQPGRDELATQVRRVARAQGHLELRRELQDLSALCMTWAAWLPTTIKVPEPEEVHAA